MRKWNLRARDFRRDPLRIYPPSSYGKRTSIDFRGVGAKISSSAGGVSWTETRNFGTVNKVWGGAFNVRHAEGGAVSRWGDTRDKPSLGGTCSRRTDIENEIESTGFEKATRGTAAVAATARQLATPWGSYVRGDLSIVSTSNLPAEAQIDVANFSAALFASQITRLSYAQSSLLIFLCLSPARSVLIVSDHKEYPQSRRMFYFLPLRGFVVDAESTYVKR